MKATSATLCLLLALTGPTLPADDGKLPKVGDSALATDETASAAEAVEHQRRQNTVTVGVLILVGVAAVGLLLIAAALIWGAKVRRMVRSTDAEPTRQDELWYLRNRKPPAADNEAATDDAPASSPPSRPPISESDDTRS